VGEHSHFWVCNALFAFEIKLRPGGSLDLWRNVSDGKRKESFQEAYYRTFISTVLNSFWSPQPVRKEKSFLHPLHHLMYCINLYKNINIDTVWQRSSHPKKSLLALPIENRCFTFYAIIDNVIGGLIVRCNAVKERFDVIWNYLDHSAAVTDQKARILAVQCCKGVDKESFVTKMRHLLFIHSAHFGKEILLPLDMLNTIYDFKPQERFPNVCICLRNLLTIPAAWQLQRDL